MYKLSLLLMLFAAAHSYADDDFDFDTEFNEDTSHIVAIERLNSLQPAPLDNDIQVPTVIELNNKQNVRALFIQRHEIPMVDIQLSFDAGSARDNEVEKGLYGVSNMAAKLLKEGTQRYTPEQVNRIFEQTGAQFSTQTTRDQFLIKLRSLSDENKIDKALDLVIELINHAEFQPQSIGLIKSNTQVGQKQLQENPTRLRDIQFYRTVYGQHPYAEPIAGTIGSNRRINTTLLKKFRDQFLVAQNMNIAITGDLTLAQAQKLSERLATKIRQGQATQPLAQPVPNTKFVIRHIPHSATQAYVSFGHIGTPYNIPERVALEVANRMFGNNSFNSILTQELRVKRGLTYSVSSAVNFGKAPGLFKVSYSTREDQLLESLDVAYKAMIHFIDQPIDPLLLNETKAGLLRSFPQRFSSNASSNAKISNVGFYGESLQEFAQYPKIIQQLTTTDIENAIRKFWHPDKLNIVIASKQLDQNQLLERLNQNIQNRTKN
ncbi:M16 family metallopeptidase [Acinetobacter sp. NCu2D-2]|uniref:M16 family metallopeptidase n=1 Tax=Acinetobacter sp. NCu2D-2 TaxID=1608473 RepID=UPI000B1E433E|nr:pitrilysin family protein [Acinetobacter sp. NCu2D-2]